MLMDLDRAQGEGVREEKRNLNENSVILSFSQGIRHVCVGVWRIAFGLKFK